ncbi:MAG: Flp family type IVb pilin [Holosporaceae bacterium]|nr:Flp family type IVb pilin [Holosporaceae bacterium]
MLISSPKRLLGRLRRNKKGATIIEYILIVTLICVACTAAFRNVGGGYQKIYNNLANHL